MKNCHCKKIRLSNFKQISKLQDFEVLDRDVVLHLPSKFGIG